MHRRIPQRITGCEGSANNGKWRKDASRDVMMKILVANFRVVHSGIA
jgi:hypothetical protein